MEKASIYGIMEYTIRVTFGLTKGKEKA